MGCTPDRIRLVLVLGGVLDSVSGGDSVSVLKRDVVDVVVEDVEVGLDFQDLVEGCMLS